MRLTELVNSKCRLVAILLIFLVLTGCDHSSKDTSDSAVTQEKKSLITGLSIALFEDGAFIEEPEIVDCETTAGTLTTCYKLVSAGAPADRDPGYFCPRNVLDGAEVSGSWFSKEGKGDLVDLTGEFVANLHTYYDDPNWSLYDSSTGNIRYTDTKEACQGAARPDIEERYQQNCIECELSYLERNFSRTYFIPTQPIPAERPKKASTFGIALDGSELSGPAPTNAILGSFTIAAFDDCGGHINEHQGYHYHSATGCTDRAVGDDEYAPLIGFAADGYAIYALKDASGSEADSLDECRGMSDPVRGYHYRAASPSENSIIGCLRGETVRSNERRVTRGDKEGRPRKGERPPRGGESGVRGERPPRGEREFRGERPHRNEREFRGERRPKGERPPRAERPSRPDSNRSDMHGGDY